MFLSFSPEIGRGCTFEVLNSSVSEEEGRIEVVEEISGVLTSIGIPITTPLEGLGRGRRVGGGESGNETDDMPVEQLPLKVQWFPDHTLCC